MMAFAIIVLAVETFFSGVLYGIMQVGAISYELSMFTIFFYAICTVCAIVSLIMNIKNLRDWMASKPKAVVGTILSSVALLYGVIFFVTLIISLGAAGV